MPTLTWSELLVSEPAAAGGRLGSRDHATRYVVSTPDGPEATLYPDPPSSATNYTPPPAGETDATRYAPPGDPDATGYTPTFAGGAHASDGSAGSRAGR
jgi:hypothetical protein